MRRLLRLALLTALATGIDAGIAHAAPITVAEFRWDLLTDPGIECPAGDPECVPSDPFTQSIFSLTDLWDGPGTITLFNNELVLPSGTLPLDNLEFPFAFNQVSVIGVPGSASANVSFIFEGQTFSLGATLSAPDTFAVLQFDPTTVPEPGTFGLLAMGIALLARRARRFPDRRAR